MQHRVDDALQLPQLVPIVAELCDGVHFVAGRLGQHPAVAIRSRLLVGRGVRRDGAPYRRPLYPCLCWHRVIRQAAAICALIR